MASQHQDLEGIWGDGDLPPDGLRQGLVMTRAGKGW